MSETKADEFSRSRDFFRFAVVLPNPSVSPLLEKTVKIETDKQAVASDKMRPNQSRAAATCDKPPSDIPQSRRQTHKKATVHAIGPPLKFDQKLPLALLLNVEVLYIQCVVLDKLSPGNEIIVAKCSHSEHVQFQP